MKKFDLERVLAGDAVITRCGDRPMQVLCFKDSTMDYPVMVNNRGFVSSATLEGKVYNNGAGSPNDLFMAPVIKEGWINVYTDPNSTVSNVYKTEGQAQVRADKDCVATIKITWEE